MVASKSKSVRKAHQQESKGKDGQTIDADFLRSVGGRALKLGKGGSEVWNFGWIPTENRTQGQEAIHEATVAAMPRFVIGKGPSTDDVEKALLFDLWKHPLVIQANGFEYPGVHQITGSCVGAGGGNAWFTLACVDAIIRNDPETPLIPFWLLPYGRSRYYAGDRNPGEGSFGSAFARAAREDGVIPANSPGLPAFTRTDGLVWGQSTEMSWSDGDASQTMNLLPQSRQYLVKTTAQCKSGVDVRQAVINGYSVTVASMYGHDGGRVQGTPAVLLAKRSGSWSHQMSIIAVWKHPQFGWIYWLHNQWGLRAHGICPTGAPPGGVWILEKDVDWICQDEAFAFSQNMGFPAQTFSWLV